MILLTQAALHAAIAKLRHQVAAQDRPGEAVAVALEGLGVLSALFDPAHLPAPLPDPHPTSGIGAGTVVPDGPGADARGESTQDPTRPEEGGEPPAASFALPRWSDERKALIRTDYATTTDMPGLVARINALPGPSVSADQLRGYAWNVLRIRRPRQRPKPPAPTRPVEETRWTEERKALMRAEYLTATDLGAFCAKLNALPGLPIERKRITIYAITGLQLYRGGAQRPAQPKPEPRRILTPAQETQARAFWHSLLSMEDLLARVNAHGPAITMGQLTGFASREKLGRRLVKPAAAAAQARDTSAPPAPKAEAPAAAPPSPPETAPTEPTNPAGAVAVPEPVQAGRAQSSPAPAGSARGPGRAPDPIRAPMDERDKLEARVALKKGRSVQDVAFDFGQPISVIQALAEGIAA